MIKVKSFQGLRVLDVIQKWLNQVGNIEILSTSHSENENSVITVIIFYKENH